LNNWIVAVFLGDSLTNGFQQGPGYLPPRYYPFTNLLESSLRIKLTELNTDKDIVIVNQGIDGDSTRGMLERFSRVVEPENPNLVLLWGGINDLSTKSLPESVVPNIIELVERTKSIGAIPIVLNVAPVTDVQFNEIIKKMNNLTKNFCNENEVDYIDVFSELIETQGKLMEDYSNDGVHLSDRGYQKIKPLIFRSIMMHILPLL
jgi:lysophospholipase L1-like esterase